MRWTERQQTMLKEMGLRLWLPAADVSGMHALADAQAGAEAGAAAQPSGHAQATAEAERGTHANVQADARPAQVPAVLRPAPVGADAGGLAAMGWPELRAAVPACQACGLCETRRQTVFGAGHLQADCMIVGEAPGEHEDQQGEPFVGPAGQLLDRMLSAIGLTRAEDTPARQVFIANTLKCRPPRNRNPSPEELAACRPFLSRQVALVQPKLILAMGRFAVQSLLETDEPIGRLRGRVHQWQGHALVVTYHPAYLLRQPADKAKAWDDLCLVAEQLGR